MAQFSFDTSTVAARENSFELIPAGNYPAVVEDSSIESLKSGNGQALKLTLRIVDGQYTGRKVWARLNIRHNNPEAERIAQQQLRELCDSIGITRMQDTVELHNKPVGIRVKIREDKTGQYEPTNEIAGFKSLSGTATSVMPMPGGTFPTPPATAAAAPAAASTPPWQKRAA
jgi:hypothetical protein